LRVSYFPPRYGAWQTYRLTDSSFPHAVSGDPGCAAKWLRTHFSSSKQRESADWAVQDIVGEVSSSEARAAGHGPLAFL